MSHHDVIVIGAGPAGIGAAVTAAALGLRTVIIDEFLAAGGQVYRRIPQEFELRNPAAAGPDFAIGERLRAELAGSSAECAFGHRVWFVAPGFRVDATGALGNRTWTAKCLVLATGTSERLIPFKNSTAPGVIGLAAATILLKTHQMLPGRQTVVAGCGPLLFAVAAGITKAGGRVEAILDLASRTEWLAALPQLLSCPHLLMRGLDWRRTILLARVPVYGRTAVVAVEGSCGVEAVFASSVNARGQPIGHRWRIPADSLAVGHGLLPSSEAARLLRAQHVYAPERGGWIAVRNQDMKTSVDGLYVAGDGAGISGASAAVLEGRLAALAVARGLGRLSEGAYASTAEPLWRKWDRVSRVGRAMAKLMTMRDGLIDIIDGSTVVCRCEDITRDEIERALDAGAREVNQVKTWTRCGMGPCQGRMCGEAVASIVARRLGSREAAGVWTARAPLRPVGFGDLTGDFSYSDIPIAAAPPR